MDENRKFWTCLIDGVLWLMYREWRVCPMNSTAAEAAKVLVILGE